MGLLVQNIGGEKLTDLKRPVLFLTRSGQTSRRPRYQNSRKRADVKNGYACLGSSVVDSVAAGAESISAVRIEPKQTFIRPNFY